MKESEMAGEPAQIDVDQESDDLPIFPESRVELVRFAEPSDTASTPELTIKVSRPGLARRSWRGLKSTLELTFGAAVLVVGLAVLAVIPLIQFLSLGYLLEACGRVARSGRLRDGFIGLRKAARIGALVLGTWLMLVPLRFLSSFFVSSRIIDSESTATKVLGIALFIATVLAGLHIVMACASGGRLRHFLWPFANPIRLYRRWRKGRFLGTLRDELWDFVTSLRLPYYFWLGLRGFVGALLWLFLPTTLLAAGSQAPLLGFLGAILLLMVVVVLPFLQAHFAIENRFRALFAYRTVRERFRHAPLAFWCAIACSLLFPLPLYLLKIELVPGEAGWMASILFIAFMFPSRLVTGWAYGRALRHEPRRHWIWRVFGKLGLLPIALLYILFVFLSQYTSWEGIGGLYGQHAFLLPVPFAEFANW